MLLQGKDCRVGSFVELPRKIMDARRKLPVIEGLGDKQDVVSAKLVDLSRECFPPRVCGDSGGQTCLAGGILNDFLRASPGKRLASALP